MVLIWFIGACVFSFINVLIYRVPRKMSFVYGSSICPECGHRLSGLDLIPVLGYLLLKGRCRYCGAHIPIRDSLLELFGGGMALLCFWRWDDMFAMITMFCFLALLTAITFVDLDTMEIPNGFILAILVIALISLVTMPDLSLLDRLIGMVSVSLPLLIITIIIPNAFGGGDIKLMAASGLLLGWQLSLLSLFLAIMTGGVYGMYLLRTAKKGRKDHFAFGPFLCAGMAVSLFWGNEMIDWYLQICGF